MLTLLRMKKRNCSTCNSEFALHMTRKAMVLFMLEKVLFWVGLALVVFAYASLFTLGLAMIIVSLILFVWVIFGYKKTFRCKDCECSSYRKKRVYGLTS